MMNHARNIKEKMNEFARLFSIETNIFQRFVIVYKYIRFLNSDPLIKDILQDIFDSTAKFIGKPDELLDEDKFLDVEGQALFSSEFWIYYKNLEIIHGKMKKVKACCLKEKQEFDSLRKLFSKPYSKQMLELSFKVVNSEVFDQLDQKVFITSNDKDEKTYFDEIKSILYIKGKKVPISKQNKITNAHKILKYIFITNKDNLKDDFYYAEIAEDEFADLEYTKDKNNWKKYHNTCNEINTKIQQIIDIKSFLKYNTGIKGKIKLNKKYL
ncbi:MAG: hypothetical protein ACKKL5_00820 [Candidatus Komeilibacteria bacterium]